MQKDQLDYTRCTHLMSYDAAKFFYRTVLQLYNDELSLKKWFTPNDTWPWPLPREGGASCVAIYFQLVQRICEFNPTIRNHVKSYLLPLSVADN